MPRLLVISYDCMVTAVELEALRLPRLFPRPSGAALNQTSNLLSWALKGYLETFQPVVQHGTPQQETGILSHSSDAQYAIPYFKGKQCAR